MADIADLDPVDYIDQTQRSYAELGYDAYRWAANPDAPALAALTKPLSQCRVALIASGGIYAAGQVAFTHKDDVSFRRVPIDTDPDDLRVTHFAYDQTDARNDPGVVFPARALRALADSGEIGEVAPVALTFMGGIYSQRRLHAELVGRLADEIDRLEADLVVLVPV